MPSSRHVRMTRTAIFAAVCDEDLLEHAGPFRRWALTIARAVWCLPCGAGNGKSAGFDEVDSTNTYLRDQARHGAAGGAGRRGGPSEVRAGPPRSELGVASGGQPPGVDPAASGVRRRRACTCARARWPWRPRTRAGSWPESRPCSNGRTTCSWAAPSWRGCWPRPNSTGGRWPRWSSGSGSTWPGRGRREPVAPVSTRWARRNGRWTAPSCWTGSWARWRLAVPLLERAPGRRAVAEEVRRRCATLGQAVRVIVPGGEFTGVAIAIDDAGHLVVETAAGPRPVAAGDVVHLRPAPG